MPIVRQLLTRTFFYDSDDDTEFVSGPGTEIDRSEFRAAARAASPLPGPLDACDAGGERAAPPPELTDRSRDWGSRLVPAPWLSFPPNLGLLMGAGAVRYGYSFREVPYGSRGTLRGAFATGPRRWRVWFEGDLRNLPRRAWASLRFRYSGIDFLRFYGFGNETAISAPPRFYRVTQSQVTTSASLTAFPPNSRISVGPFFAFAETQLGRGGLVDSLRPYGVAGFVEAGAAAQVEYDTRDRASVARRGVHLVATGRLVPSGWTLPRRTGP